MFNVYQPWDPLKVCVVGKSYPPEFYNFIQNNRVRNVMEKIAYETEEDYQKLIKLLQTFGVEVWRPTVTNNYEEYLFLDKIFPPPMTPRDYTGMIGNVFYIDNHHNYDVFKGSDWPTQPPKSIKDLDSLPENVKEDVVSWITANNHIDLKRDFCFKEIIEKIKQHNVVIMNNGINTAMTTRIGKDLYFGTHDYQSGMPIKLLQEKYSLLFPDYRCHVINTSGHSDSTFCPVTPGLIVSLNDIPTYTDTFPNWEVIYLPEQSWERVKPFLKLKRKNKGKWWVPGEELNNDFTEFVESWLNHWVGYVEETVFDVNMLVIDEKNVVCNNYNEQVFKALDRYGVTPHIINFRHRYFWDGGLHCITSDIHREGTMKDYFPERA